MSVLHVAGARLRSPRAAAVIRELVRPGVAQRLGHTDQHYDERMSGVFRYCCLPEPDVKLGSSGYAKQTITMMVQLGELFLQTGRPSSLSTRDRSRRCDTGTPAAGRPMSSSRLVRYR